jgi:hypothetical protein
MEKYSLEGATECSDKPNFETGLAGFYYPSWKDQTTDPLMEICWSYAYCPSGTTEPIMCPDNKESPSGSSSIDDCITVPKAGFIIVSDINVRCPVDTYCAIGDEVAT